MESQLCFVVALLVVPILVEGICEPTESKTLVNSPTYPATPVDLSTESAAHPICLEWTIEPVPEKQTMLRVYNVAIDESLAGIHVMEGSVERVMILNGENAFVVSETVIQMSIIFESLADAADGNQLFTVEASALPDEITCVGNVPLTATDVIQIATAPGYPITTGTTELCQYEVSEPDGGPVTVTFLTIELADAPDDCSELLEVSANGVEQTICVSESSSERTYTGPLIIVKFSGGEPFNRGTGFVFQYSKKVAEPTEPTEGPTEKVSRLQSK
ncbi:hypothetical protein ScPMuIL_008118 [Solemya velum]